MTKVQNKNSLKYHTSRTRVKSSSISRVKARDRKIFFIAKKSILTVIILSSMAVILVLLFVTFKNPEYIIKSSIESYATNYYENHLYSEIAASNQDSISEILQKYVTTGFSLLPLRQLIVFNEQSQNDTPDIISRYCDIGDSYVQFFPEPPFGKTNYRVEYHYSCTF